MSDYNEMMLNNHLYQLDADSAKEEAIELLAEQLIAATAKTARDVITASNYNLTACEVIKETDHSDEFNEMFYKIAENLIKISEGK